MIQLTETEDIFETVSSVFIGDYDLAARFHYVSPSSCKTTECAEFTTQYILSSIPKKAVFYSVTSDNNKIGYCCIDDTQLWDMGISEEFRNNNDITPVWNAISEKIGGSFLIRLYENNYRDINWLIKKKIAVPLSIEHLPNNIWHWHGIRDSKEPHSYYIPLSQILLKFNK